MFEEKNKHPCQVSGEYEFLGEKYQNICIGKIKGKVLKVGRTDDKYDKSDELCIKIRINKQGEWKEGYEESKKYLVYYSLEDPWGKNIQPQEGKTYWFFLHERKGIGHKGKWRGWQWTHDWKLIEDEKAIY